jgi:hypothetical protein
MNEWRLKTIIIGIILALTMMACNTVETISKSELYSIENKLSNKQEIFYKGSSDKFDYFIVQGGQKPKLYRVNYGELILNQRFLLSEDQGKWIRIDQAIKK